MTDQTQATTNKTFDDERVQTANKKFLRALGNGVTMTQEAFVIFTDAVDIRDTTNLVRLIEDCKAKNDNNAARTLGKIAEMVWPKCQFIKAGKDKKGNEQPAKIKIKGITEDNKVMDNFCKAVEAKLSMRGSAILTKIQNKPELTDKQKRAANRKKAFETCDRVAAFGFKNDMTLVEIVARVEAAYKKAQKDAAAS